MGGARIKVIGPRECSGLVEWINYEKGNLTAKPVRERVFAGWVRVPCFSV